MHTFSRTQAMAADFYEQVANAIAELVEYRPHSAFVHRMTSDSPIGYVARILCREQGCYLFWAMDSNGYTKSIHEITDPFNEHVKQNHGSRI